MPNRMSEDISDRMPEDVPVRLCINVMVGITRSKVFFLKEVACLWFLGGFYNKEYLLDGSSHLISGLVHPSFLSGLTLLKNPM